MKKNRFQTRLVVSSLNKLYDQEFSESKKSSVLEPETLQRLDVVIFEMSILHQWFIHTTNDCINTNSVLIQVPNKELTYNSRLFTIIIVTHHIYYQTTYKL